MIVADGVDGVATQALYEALNSAGAVPRLVGAQLGSVQTDDNEALEVDVTIEASPAVLFDALVVLGGEAVIAALSGNGPALEFIKDTYRHCKPILAVNAGALLKDILPVAARSKEPDSGLLQVDAVNDDVIESFVAAIARHRAFERYSDPPRV